MWFQGKEWNKTREKLIKVLETLPDLEGKPLVVALSGGSDSVFLLTALASLEGKYEYELLPVYIHHHFQKENDLFERIANVVSQKIGKECKTLHAKPVPKKTNAEDWMRKERYKLLEEYRKKTKASYITVAHHQDDQAETILAHLIRGCGIWGLRGMKPVSKKVIRPLIFCSKKEIKELLHSTTLPYYNDRTNYSSEYQRNKIRHKLLPYLEDNYNPKAIQHLAQLAETVREYGENIDKERKDVLKKLEFKKKGKQFSVNYSLWKSLSPFWQKEIMWYLATMNDKEVSFDTVQKICTFVKSGKGEFRTREKKIKVTGDRIAFD